MKSYLLILTPFACIAAICYIAMPHPPTLHVGETWVSTPKNPFTNFFYREKILDLRGDYVKYAMTCFRNGEKVSEDVESSSRDYFLVGVKLEAQTQIEKP